MAFFTDVESQIAQLRELLGADVEADALAQRMAQLGADDLVTALGIAAGVGRWAERIAIAGAGIVAARSTCAAGQNGLAQSLGHRNPAALLQEISGAARSEAERQVRLGTALLADAEAPRGSGVGSSDAGASSDSGSADGPPEGGADEPDHGGEGDAAGCGAGDDGNASDAVDSGLPPSSSSPRPRTARWRNCAQRPG